MNNINMGKKRGKFVYNAGLARTKSIDAYFPESMLEKMTEWLEKAENEQHFIPVLCFL